MMGRRDDLRSILSDSIQEYAEQAGLQVDVNDDLRLFGRDSALDSLGLVTVLASFESRINDRFGAEIVVADERAMSMQHSPFRTVSTLIDYACTLLHENGKAG